MRKYDGLWVPEVEGDACGKTCRDRAEDACHIANAEDCMNTHCAECLYDCRRHLDAYRRYETGQPSEEPTE